VNVALWLSAMFVLGIALMGLCYWFLDICESM